MGAEGFAPLVPRTVVRRELRGQPAGEPRRQRRDDALDGERFRRILLRDVDDESSGR
jgi:hypothetical protein